MIVLIVTVKIMIGFIIQTLGNGQFLRSCALRLLALCSLSSTPAMSTTGPVFGILASDAGLVRPSVYLISKTSILGGEGTLENPYEIAD